MCVYVCVCVHARMLAMDALCTMVQVYSASMASRSSIVKSLPPLRQAAPKALIDTDSPKDDKTKKKKKQVKGQVKRLPAAASAVQRLASPAFPSLIR